MNSLSTFYRRAGRALFAVALLGAGSHAFAIDAAQPGLNVLIIDETRRGWDKGVLDRHGIASRVSALNKGKHADALREVLRDQNVRMRLAGPTGCPSASTREACASVRQIKDVDLPAAIADAKGSTLLVLWPEAAYFPDEQLYISYVDVDIIEKGKARPGPFYLGYRDWECTAECVPSAFEASAKEIAAMVRYLLELGPTPQTRSVPASWQSKPLVSSVDKWSNTCATKLEDNRLIREYGERFWLSDPKTRTLTSTAWRGCNIFDAGS
jgi:hypothetical protein